MNTIQTMTREDYIRHHTQQTIERGYQIGLFAPKEVIAKGEKRQPEKLKLRGKTGIERRIEKCVLTRRNKYNEWPVMAIVANILHMPAETIIGVILKSEVLDYTVPAKPQYSNVDAVMSWSIEIKEAA
jgi:hypothetical protein